VCRQLAFWLAKDMTCFDVVSLAYALVTYVAVGGAMARASVAPRADGSRDAVGTSSALPPANQRLVPAAPPAARRATRPPRRLPACITRLHHPPASPAAHRLCSTACRARSPGRATLYGVGR